MSIVRFFYDDALIRFHIEDQVAKLLDASAKPAPRTAASVAKLRLQRPDCGFLDRSCTAGA